MKPVAISLVFAFLATTAPAMAADSIGGQNEKPIEITGKVVDLLCELTGRCTLDCGGGRRQLGVLQPNGKLVPVIKSPDIFAGAQADLAPLCGRTITMDGLLFENLAMPVYMVQGIKTDPAAKEFSTPDAFIKQWVSRHGATDEWFRNDPLVKEQISRNGVLGKPGLQPKPQ